MAVDSGFDRDEFDRWLKQARHTLSSAERDLQAGDYAWSCFKSQQAGEYAAKAVLRGYGRLAAGNSILRLLEDMKKGGLRVDATCVAHARLLDRHYIPSRYPDAAQLDEAAAGALEAYVHLLAERDRVASELAAVRAEARRGYGRRILAGLAASLAAGLAALARAERQMGDLAAAWGHAREAVHVAQESALPACEMWGEMEAGLALLAQNAWTALDHTRRAVELASQAHAAWIGTEQAHLAHASVLQALGRLDEAAEQAGLARAILAAKAERIPDPDQQQRYLQLAPSLPR